MNEPSKKLYRYEDGQVLAGVIVGFAKYFTIDVTMLRVIFAIFVLITGFFPGIVAYVIAIFIMPLKLQIDAEDITIINL